jgi:SAM-dependent methyltransferase
VAEFYNRTRRSSSIAKKLLRHGRILELPVYWLLKTSDLAHEGFENSGSYRFADHIYRGEPSGSYGIGRWLDKRILGMRAVESFRSRFLMARDELSIFLQERAAGRSADDGYLNVLSVPCGIPRDLVAAAEKFRSAGGETSGIRFHGLDLDGDVLREAKRFAGEHGIDLITYQGDAMDPETFAGEFDFITSTGLGEFLDDNQLSSLYVVFHSVLRPGGVMVTSAMRRLRFSDYLLRLAELHVHYRSAEDLAAIARRAGFVRLTTSADAHGIQGFLKATK